MFKKKIECSTEPTIIEYAPQARWSQSDTMGCTIVIHAQKGELTHLNGHAICNTSELRRLSAKLLAAADWMEA